MIGTIEGTVLVGALAAIGSVLYFTIATRTPPTPSGPAIHRALLSLLPPTGGGTIVEMGSGWGTLTYRLARAEPDARVEGVEISPLPFLVSWLIKLVTRQRNMIVRRCDFMRRPLADADVVVCYLMPETMETLAPKFAAELRPGAVVVSAVFRLPGREPAAAFAIGDQFRSNVYVYRY